MISCFFLMMIKKNSLAILTKLTYFVVMTEKQHNSRSITGGK